MSIKTDSKGLAEPKDPDSCLIFELYCLFADREQQAELAAKYRGGNFGYGHAKQELFVLLDQKLEEPRARYNELILRPDDVRDILKAGALRARGIAQKTLQEVREAVGL
jgi:tryptophanyl-tRNA synthetase